MSILKDIRESTGLSQRELAKLSGIARSTIHSMETGETKTPDPVKVDRLLYEMAKFIDLAYVAGLIDRASCLTITKNKAGSSSTSKHPHYVAKLIFTSRHQELCELVRRVLGTGSVGSNGMHSERPRYQYYAFSAQCEQALEKLYPYLKVKRELTRVILEFRRKMSENHRLHQIWYKDNKREQRGEVPVSSDSFWDQERINQEYDFYYQEVTRIKGRVCRVKK